MSDSVSDYLRIPEEYGRWLGELRWSASGDVVEDGAGHTFAFSPQIGLFLEGFLRAARPIHFGHVLHLLQLLGHGKCQLPAEARRLCRLYAAAGRPVRNAGALCAMLCRRVPPVAGSVDGDAVCRHLASLPLMWEVRTCWSLRRHLPEPQRPVPGPEGLEVSVLQALAPLDAETLAHWLRHGRGPVSDAGAQIARQIAAAKPPTLAGVLARLARHRRLAGAVPFVAQLVSALALPPRSLAHHELPMGGYADVTTRGRPEQILVSQLALDGIEFLRRYAENELLYFRREEPHTQVREDLVLVLDQGVRTWGDVRLVLTAAVFAFGKLAARRKLPFLLGATSSGGKLIDPLEVGEKVCAELLEASDLSANPGLALEQVLEERVQGARDVILLTHPRSLVEADVAAAAQRVRPGTRLFAVTVDRQGEARLCQVKHGTPVALSQFRVDMSKATPQAPSAPAGGRGAALPWQGEVEPVPFPFRLGITPKLQPHLLCFDSGGEWLLAGAGQGMLHLARVDGSHSEILPRGLHQAKVLTSVSAILGVIGGFVVTGCVGKWLVAMHYDLEARKCTAHLLGSALNADWDWFYFREFHSVVARSKGVKYGLDLTTGETYTHPRGEGGTSRAGKACFLADNYEVPPPRLALRADSRTTTAGGPSILLEADSGMLFINGVSPAWEPKVPLADGKPVLEGSMILQAELRGSTLAVLCSHPAQAARRVLRVFRGPDCTPSGEFVYRPAGSIGFTLSEDGRRLARHAGEGLAVQVFDLVSGARPLLAARMGKLHPRLEVELGDGWLVVRVGRLNHLIRWQGGQLEFRSSREHKQLFLKEFLAGPSLNAPSVFANQAHLPHAARYDPYRFREAARGAVGVVIDIFGHVVVCDSDWKLVCMFCVIGDQVAAWMPDGTCCGAAALLLGPETPNAAARIGAALLAAGRRGREDQA